MRLSVQAPPVRNCFLRWREKSEELPHCRRSGSSPGKHLDAKAFEHQAQNALVLIECGGLVSRLGGRRADKNCHDPTSAVCAIAACLVEYDDQQSILLE